jgi:hypothetical protein
MCSYTSNKRHTLCHRLRHKSYVILFVYRFPLSCLSTSKYDAQPSRTCNIEAAVSRIVARIMLFVSHRAVRTDWPYNTSIQANKWYRLTTFVRVNAGGGANGLLKIWWNSGVQARLEQFAPPSSRCAHRASASHRLRCHASPLRMIRVHWCRSGLDQEKRAICCIRRAPH